MGLSKPDQVIAVHQGRTDFGLVIEFIGFLQQQFVNVELPMRSKAIEPMQIQFQRERGPPKSGYGLPTGLLSRSPSSPAMQANAALRRGVARGAQGPPGVGS